MKKVGAIFKESVDAQLKDGLKLNEGLFLFNYSGATSADLTKLRKNLKGVKAKMFVTKNSFVNLAFKSLNNKGKEIFDFIDGPTALIFVKDDPIGVSKVLTDFAKAHETIVLKGGYFNDKIINSKDFKVLANIPPRQVLYQQLAVVCNAPVTKLAMSLNQIMAKVVYALKAVSDKKGK